MEALRREIAVCHRTARRYVGVIMLIIGLNLVYRGAMRLYI